MEVAASRYSGRWVRMLLCVLFLCFSHNMMGQHYTIRDGKMYIEISKKISDAELDAFIAQFDLSDLPLKQLLRNNKKDSILKLGWDIRVNNEAGLIICKVLGAAEDLFNPSNKTALSDSSRSFAELFPATNNGVVLGYNRFRNKAPFVIIDSIVRFFLRGSSDAKNVYLAGSFNNWVTNALRMLKTDSGWIVNVKLDPGKYWYKFIVDGNWTFDNDNVLRENDGLGNINSVYFRPNVVFRLDGFTGARNVYLAGSFNNWKPKDLSMIKTTDGWQLPVYLAEGTHPYKFVVDGKWYADPGNPEKVDDGTGGNNSVIRIGTPHLFKLEGYENAKKVMLVGSFNQWREFEWPMKKTAGGWELPYVIGRGNYEYKFRVDGKWIADPANPLTSGNGGNSFITIQPNYTFRLKGFADARSVYLAGDFNEWKPNQLAMRKQGDEWIFPLHLRTGKTRYKFIVDGKWIVDPGNKLWEQNEHNTGNSVIWIEQ